MELQSSFRTAQRVHMRAVHIQNRLNRTEDGNPVPYEGALILSCMREFGTGERGTIREPVLKSHYFATKGFETGFAINGMDINTQDLDALASTNDFQLENDIMEDSARATQELTILDMIAEHQEAATGAPGAEAVSDDEDEEKADGNAAGAA